MGTFVDFQQLKSTVSIGQVLDMLGVRYLMPHGDTLRGECPCCKEGNGRSFVVTPAKNSFYCFSEKKGGDIIELAARFYRIPQKEAAQRIAAHVGLNGVGPAPSAEPAAPAQAPSTGGFDPKAYQASLDPSHDPGPRTSLSFYQRRSRSISVC